MDTRIAKKAASTFAEAAFFAAFGFFSTPYFGNTSLAVTKYGIPLRLHRQGNIGMADGGNRRGIHGRFSLKMGVFYSDLLQNYRVRLRTHRRLEVLGKRILYSKMLSEV
ncbi:MAG TPA: hypothetical protein PKJ84_01850 [Anaerolineales bacterium]|nr:hypothetical protein [Anaerolineales bacterium]HNO92883.1 hypothetical protein [Anaerolineales bacterium]